MRNYFLSELNKIAVGNVLLNQAAALAPMAGVADRAYRYICKEFGACYVVSEMVSSKGICYSDKKTHELLTVTDYENPMGIQLFGDDPDFMARATEQAMQYNPQIIDINMGCPVPKVAGNGCGSALMRTPEIAYKVVCAVVKASNVPVTVKIRKGWDDDNVNAVSFAQLMESAGAAAITVHGRTTKQMYKPPVDLDIIKAVKQSVSIPVIGNGGIISPIDAKKMYDYTGCDLVMVGQSSYGKPYIFKQIEHYLLTGEILPEPSVGERLALMLRHIEMIVKFKGEKSGMREARKHAAWYIHGANGAAAFRNACGKLTTLDDLKRLIEDIMEHE